MHPAAPRISVCSHSSKVTVISPSPSRSAWRCSPAHVRTTADDLRRLLGRATLVRFDPVGDFEGAAFIYRACRRSGVTPRGLVDCMIASVTQRANAALLSWDRDMARIADIITLELDDATLRG
ncbi:hypothetical protein BH23ACT10_BH23ACT10_11350 [soil metagenome]